MIWPWLKRRWNRQPPNQMTFVLIALVITLWCRVNGWLA